MEMAEAAGPRALSRLLRYVSRCCLPPPPGVATTKRSHPVWTPAPSVWPWSLLAEPPLASRGGQSRERTAHGGRRAAGQQGWSSPWGPPPGPGAPGVAQPSTEGRTALLAVCRQSREALREAFPMLWSGSWGASSWLTVPPGLAELGGVKGDILVETGRPTPRVP